MKKILFLFGAIIFLYGILFWKALEIDVFLRFPWIAINTLQYTSDIEASEIHLENAENLLLDHNGEVIHGIWLWNDSQQTVYYFHGSGGDLRYFYNDIRYIASLWYNVLAFEYPGYGKSTWFPEEQRVYEYSKKLLEHAQDTYWFVSKDTILWGYSVGTAIALEAAQHDKFAAVILLAAYSSAYNATQSEIGFIWQKLLFLKDAYMAEEYIKSIDAPILIVHGEEDSILDYSWSERLYKHADKENTSFIGIEDGNHYNLWEKIWPHDDFQEFLQKITQH